MKLFDIWWFSQMFSKRKTKEKNCVNTKMRLCCITIRDLIEHAEFLNCQPLHL